MELGVTGTGKSYFWYCDQVWSDGGEGEEGVDGGHGC